MQTAKVVEQFAFSSVTSYSTKSCKFNGGSLPYVRRTTETLQNIEPFPVEFSQSESLVEPNPQVFRANYKTNVS